MTTETIIEDVNYSKEFIQSILAYFSYVNMDGSSDGDITWGNFKNEDLTTDENSINFLNNFKKYLGNKYDATYAANELANSQFILDFFMDNFIVTDQLVTRGFDGFSAVTYELKNDLTNYGYVAGDTFVVYRGTEAKQIADWATDFNITFSDRTGDYVLTRKVNEFFNHMSQETHGRIYLEETIKKINTQPDGTMLDVPRQVYIAGHSLGGFLSARSLLSIEEKYGIDYALKYVKSVSTFNGAGLSVLDGWLTGKDKLEAIVKNFYSVRGFNVTSSSFIDMFKGNGTTISFFEHLGKRYPTVTENEGVIDNHNMSLLMHTFGFFSTLDTLVQGYPDNITDIYDQKLTGEASKLYVINQLIMNASYLESDFGKALSSLSKRIIEGFGLSFDYNSSIATFMGLKDYFVNNPNLKIKLYDNFQNVGLTDTNSNRAAFYSLMNDLSYVLVVPESYNEGIFKRDGNSEFYNIENYTQEYIDLKVIYNKAVTELMERKLMQVLPYYIDMPELNGKKYAFIVETTQYDKQTVTIKDVSVDVSFNGSAYQKDLFINSNEDDISNGSVQYVYMKSDASNLLNVSRNNSIVFDTALNDSINIYSNNNTIYSMNGIDHITLLKDFNQTELTGNKILINDNTDIVYVVNYSLNKDSLTIDFKNSTSNLKLNAVGLTNNFESNKIILSNGNQTIEITGVFNLDLNGSIVNYKNIYSIMSNFSEMFIADGFTVDTVVNSSFINEYMDLIKDRYNDGVIIPDNKISERFAADMIKKLQQYSTDSGINTSSIQNDINAHIYVSELDTTFNDEIQTIMNQTTVVIEGLPLKDFIYSKLNNYADAKYNSLNRMTQEDNAEYNGSYVEKVDGMYYVKGTKNYTNYIDGAYRDYYVWDGKYYYDRVDANGDKIDAFYGNTTTAGVGYKKYLKEDLLIQDEFLFNGRQNGEVYGSDGSDIIIGAYVYGQSLYYLENNNILDGDAQLRQNGNDILIGYRVSAYSGNNLIMTNDKSLTMGSVLKGGRGNDIIIAKEQNTTIIADQNIDVTETSLNENLLLLLNHGTVFSSNGKNTIYAKNGTVFATGNDTVYIENGRYYSYKLDITNSHYAAQEQDESKFYNETGVSFYNKYKLNEQGNTIYDYGYSLAYLKQNDNITLTSGNSNIFGLGYNTFNITGSTNTITSGGNSNFILNGNNNNLYLGIDDEYTIIFAQENNLYARGIKDNIEDQITSDTYILTGLNNKLYLGDTSYNITLNGHQTSVFYTKNTDSLQKYQINEIGETTLDIGSYDLNNLSINTKNNLNIKGDNSIGYINTLDIKASVGVVPSNDNIKIRLVDIANLVMKADDLVGLDINGNVNHANLDNVNIQGHIKNNETFNFNGYVEGLNIEGNSNTQSKVHINGFINGLSISNANEFSYIKSFNQDLESNINIYQSNLQTIGGTNNYTSTNLKISYSFINELSFNNVSLSNFILDKSTINKLYIESLKQSTMILTFDDINDLTIAKYEDSSFNINGSSTQLNANINGLKISGNNLNDFYFNKTTLGPNGSNVNFSLNDFVDITIKTSLESNLQLSNSTGIVNIDGEIVSGSLNNLNVLNIYNAINIYLYINNIDTLNLDITNLAAKPTFSDTNNINHLNLISTDEVIITKSMIGDFLLNNIYTNDFTLKVGANHLSKSEIASIRNNLIHGEAYAIIKSTGIEYIEPEITEPETPYIDENNVYQGTSNNDTFDLTESSKQYVLNGKGGDDIYNFKSYHYMMNTLNYNSGDGLDTVNVTQYVALTLNLGTISVNELTFTSEKNIYGIISTLNIFKNGIQIFKLNNYEKMNLNLKTLEKTYQSYEITKLMSTINGTDGNDVINGTNQNNYIYAGKGDDIINLTGYYTNEIYYNKDDGHDTVNAPTTNYKVIFENTIDTGNITYQSIGVNSFNILLNNDIIMTINEAQNATLQYLSNYQTITGTSILADLSAINGTDDADVITVDTATIVKAKGGDDIINVNHNQASIYAGTGNDIININYTDLSDESTVYYEKGDGLTTVKLLQNVYNSITVDFKNMSSSQFKYEYSVDNHNTLNIYYSNTSFPLSFEKVMVIENYRRVFSETYTTGRANLIIGGQFVYHNTIDTQAESNYNAAINANNLMNSSMAEMNAMIETMASNDTADDSSVNAQSTSTILKKEE